MTRGENKKHTALIAIAIVVGGLLVLVGTGVVFMVVLFNSLKSTETYQHAAQVATQDPRAIAASGAPVKTRWYFTANISTSGPTGKAELAIPVSASRQSGTVYVQ